MHKLAKPSFIAQGITEQTEDHNADKHINLRIRWKFGDLWSINSGDYKARSVGPNFFSQISQKLAYFTNYLTMYRTDRPTNFFRIDKTNISVEMIKVTFTLQ